MKERKTTRFNTIMNEFSSQLTARRARVNEP
jgi:hypothetical protein